MHVRITGDFNAESGVDEVLNELSGPIRRFFLPKDYGSGLSGLVIVLMCRDSGLNFKRRIRVSSKEKKLYMDVMLDLLQMRPAEHQERKRDIIERLAQEIPIVLRKYALKEFDEVRFVGDLKSCFRSI